MIGNDRMKQDFRKKPDPLEQVFTYHQATKHHFQGYARGPGYLDWASQPNSFRRYAGARVVTLEKIPPSDEPFYDDAFVEGRISPAELAEHLSTFLRQLGDIGLEEHCRPVGPYGSILPVEICIRLRVT